MAAAPPAASPAARLYSGSPRSAHPTPDNPQALCHAGGLWWVVLGCCAAAARLDQACMAACSPGAPPALPLPLTCCAWLQGGARTRALEDASRSSRQRLTGAPASHALVSRHLSGVGGRMPAAGSEAAGGSGGCTSARAAEAGACSGGVLRSACWRSAACLPSGGADQAGVPERAAARWPLPSGEGLPGVLRVGGQLDDSRLAVSVSVTATTGRCPLAENPGHVLALCATWGGHPLYWGWPAGWVCWASRTSERE